MHAAELVIWCLGAFVISLLQLNRKQAFHQAEVLRIANSTLSLCKQTKPVKLKHMAESSSIGLGFECANERENFASQVCENMKPKTLLGNWIQRDADSLVTSSCKGAVLNYIRVLGLICIAFDQSQTLILAIVSSVILGFLSFMSTWFSEPSIWSGKKPQDVLRQQN